MPQQHLFLLPSNPLLSLRMGYFFFGGEGTPIHSVSMDFLLHHGSARDISNDYSVLANDMVLGLPIHMSPLLAVNVISLTLPINLMDGLRWQDVLFCFGACLWKKSYLFLFSSQLIDTLWIQIC